MPVDGTRLLRKHEGFSANLWCLWVSDISYIQTEDLEDSDEGEYPMRICAHVFYGSAVARARASSASSTRLSSILCMATFLSRSGSPSGYFRVRACVPRDAWHPAPSRRGVISVRLLAADFEVRIAVRRCRRRGARPGVS